MRQTAMPGTLGVIQPGYFYTGTTIWQGPFDTQIAFGFTRGAVLSVPRGRALAIAPNVASQFAAGDAAWFEFH